jgi:hypothetical protein
MFLRTFLEIGKARRALKKIKNLVHPPAVHCSNLQTSNKVALSHSLNLQQQGEPHGPWNISFRFGSGSDLPNVYTY